MRKENVWYYLGLIGVIGMAVLTTVNIDPASLTSWSIVWETFKSILSNPFQLCCIVFAIAGIWNNPTTPGLS